MGAFDYISNICSVTNTKRALTRKKRRKPLQTVELKVKMDCNGCERRVRHAVSSLEGVTAVQVNRKQNKVSVTGHVDAKKVMSRVKSTGKRPEKWPYVEHHLVHYPYVAHVYDKNAPSGFVRNVAHAAPSSGAAADAEEYTSLFSDENPNACSIM